MANILSTQIFSNHFLLLCLLTCFLPCLLTVPPGVFVSGCGSAVQYSEVRWNSVLSSVQFTVVYCAEFQCTVVQWILVQCTVMQCNTLQCSALYSTVFQFSSMTFSALQCNTVKYNVSISVPDVPKIFPSLPIITLIRSY